MYFAESNQIKKSQTMNYTYNTFELLDFRKTDWSGLCAIKSVNWKVLLPDCIPSKYLSVIIGDEAAFQMN